MTTPDGCYQDLLLFTVKICDADGRSIGTGVIVSADGVVVSCAHVVRLAGWCPRSGRRHLSAKSWLLHKLGLRTITRSHLCIEFAQESELKRLWPAEVIPCCGTGNDDVAFLKLTDHPTLRADQVAVLGGAQDSRLHGFQSYGFRRLSDYQAGYALGTIQGLLPARPRTRPNVQLKSSEINHGMSGSAVLDIERNLIVALVSETYVPPSGTKDNETAWGVDVQTLVAHWPKQLSSPTLRNSFPLRRASAPRAGSPVDPVASLSLQPELTAAPQVVPEWVGRQELLKEISEDWRREGRRVVGLIGFGGEGKTSLARKWIDSELLHTDRPAPDSVFWWSFYERQSVEEFLEKALTYLTRGDVDLRRFPSSRARVELLARMIADGRHVIILDGAEVMQYQDGTRYGQFNNSNLRDFLIFFAGGGGKSLCLVTSRAPLMDLISFTGYAHRDVTKLSMEDGRALLRELGVHGEPEALDEVVRRWDGHALSLSLLGGYLVDHYHADAARQNELPTPLVNEHRYERVHRLLRRYDEHLSPAEKNFLMLFSLFRLPADEVALTSIFRRSGPPDVLLSPLRALPDEEFQQVLDRLVRYRILRRNPAQLQYTIHPLIQQHYLKLLESSGTEIVRLAHRRFFEHYVNASKVTSAVLTLQMLSPSIEAVYHGTAAGDYDKAWGIFWQNISFETRFAVLIELGAYDTTVALIKDFFPNGNFKAEPLVKVPVAAQTLLIGAGYTSLSLGDLQAAMPVLVRCVTKEMEQQSPRGTGLAHRVLAEVYGLMGRLAECSDAADNALRLARRTGDHWLEPNALGWQAWVRSLRGELEEATRLFEQATAMYAKPSDELGPSERFVNCPQHLRLTGNIDAARRLAIQYLELALDRHYVKFAASCNRVLGDLASDTGDQAAARHHYDLALQTVRGTSDRKVLIETLCARGAWLVERGDLVEARDNLHEALDDAIRGGYRLFEADTRIALAKLALTSAGIDLARKEAEHALKMSSEIGYYWGRTRAERVIQGI